MLGNLMVQLNACLDRSGEKKESMQKGRKEG
jgi:hypothetical protein